MKSLISRSISQKKKKNRVLRMEKCLKAENEKLSTEIINDITNRITIVHKINCFFLMSVYIHFWFCSTEEYGGEFPLCLTPRHNLLPGVNYFKRLSYSARYAYLKCTKNSSDPEDSVLHGPDS